MDSPVKLHGSTTGPSVLGIGRTKWFELIASGELRSVKIGRRRLVSEAALAEFVTKLEADAA